MQTLKAERADKKIEGDHKQASRTRGLRRQPTLMAFFVVALFISSEAQAITASWYDELSCQREGTWQKYGGRNADGTRFDSREMSCASWDYNFGQRLRITNLDNGRTVEVVCRDRGPSRSLYKRGRKIDLSRESFKKISELEKGVVPISIEEIK